MYGVAMLAALTMPLTAITPPSVVASSSILLVQSGTGAGPGTGTGLETGKSGTGKEMTLVAAPSGKRAFDAPDKPAGPWGEIPGGGGPSGYNDGSGQQAPQYEGEKFKSAQQIERDYDRETEEKAGPGGFFNRSSATGLRLPALTSEQVAAVVSEVRSEELVRVLGAEWERAVAALEAEAAQVMGEVAQVAAMGQEEFAEQVVPTAD